MITKKRCYNALILLTLVSFATFGSVSHLFSLALIILVLATGLTTKNSLNFDTKSIALYFVLAGCFFIFALSSINDENIFESLASLGPLLSIPLIGLLVVFHDKTNFKLSASRVAKYSQTAIFSASCLYTFLSGASNSGSVFNEYYSVRVELFSGNPIPFSYAILGISVFCLADWWNSSPKNRFIAFSLFLVGCIFSGFLSGTRGSLLSIVLIFPFLLFYLTRRLKLTSIITLISVGLGLFLIQLDFRPFGNNPYIDRLVTGIDTFTASKKVDYSSLERIQMWVAAGKAISEKPLFGYGVTERFNAIIEYLPNSFSSRYSHPHNDILAGTIGIGLLGGVATFISLFSVLLAALLNYQKVSERTFLSLMILVPTLITANVSTIFYNDISAAWLAFSTYLIWIVDFGEK